MSDHYGREKFHLALLDLVAPGDIHSRVSSALSQHLLHIKEETDLPATSKEDFAAFKASLDLAHTPGGHASDLINAMSEVEAEKVAQQIVSLYGKVMTG